MVKQSTFHKHFLDWELDEVDVLWKLLGGVSVHGGNDSVRWRPHSIGSFSMRYYYYCLRGMGAKKFS